MGAACLADPALPAERVAGTPPVTVARDESLERAAFLMANYQVTHLIVVEDGRAAGIIRPSTWRAPWSRSRPRRPRRVPM